MKPEYEQLELDTRPALLRAISSVTNEAISTAREMTQRHNWEAAEQGHTVPGPVRNRHEAYGIAAEQMGKINSAVKSIKEDTAKLLITLSEPNRSAVEAVSDIYNSAANAAVVLVGAAAEMKRTMENLYDVEALDIEPTPMEQLANGEFQEAEELDPGDVPKDEPVNEEMEE